MEPFGAEGGDTRGFRSLVGLSVLSIGVAGLVPVAGARVDSPAAGSESRAPALSPALAAPTQAPALSVGHDMPSWSPDGRSIAFVGFRNGRVGDIFTIGPDGRGERRLTATPRHEDMPRWSPDGTRIAFVRHTGGALINFHIFVMNADGSGQKQVTHDGAPNSSPAWSPDGTKIAYVSQRDFSSQIYVMNADGSEQTRLTEIVPVPTGQAASNDSPDWSPDGRLIAFASNRGELLAWRLYTMRTDGTDVRPLTANPVLWHNERRPAWSPDGSRVAFVSGPGRDIPVTNSEIYVIDTDGSNERRLTRSDQGETTPSWSPDGSQLAIARDFGRLRPELYIIPAVRGPARKITGGTLKFVGLTTTPSQPRAGKLFTVDLAVTPSLTGSRLYADVACYAVVGRTLLEVALGTVVKGRLRCTWLVPRAHRGKRLTYLASAMFGHSLVSRTLTAPID